MSWCVRVGKSESVGTIAAQGRAYLKRYRLLRLSVDTVNNIKDETYVGQAPGSRFTPLEQCGIGTFHHQHNYV